MNYKSPPGRGLLTSKSIEERKGYLDDLGHDLSEIQKSNVSYELLKNKIESYVGSTDQPGNAASSVVWILSRNVKRRTIRSGAALPMDSCHPRNVCAGRRYSTGTATDDSPKNRKAKNRRPDPSLTWTGTGTRKPRTKKTWEAEGQSRCRFTGALTDDGELNVTIMPPLPMLRMITRLFRGMPTPDAETL